VSRAYDFIDSLSERSIAFRLAMFIPLLAVSIVMGAWGGFLVTFDYTFGRKDSR